jgi:hypothetical protein
VTRKGNDVLRHDRTAFRTARRSAFGAVICALCPTVARAVGGVLTVDTTSLACWCRAKVVTTATAGDSSPPKTRASVHGRMKLGNLHFVLHSLREGRCVPNGWIQ